MDWSSDAGFSMSSPLSLVEKLQPGFFVLYIVNFGEMIGELLERPVGCAASDWTIIVLLVLLKAV